MAVSTLTVKDFDTRTKEGTCAVHFHAETSGDSRIMKMIMKIISEEFPFMSFYQVDVLNETALEESFRIHNVPVLAVLKDGKEIDRLNGVENQDDIMTFIARAITK